MGHRRPGKRPYVECLDEEEEKVYKFKILLPNGTSMGLTLREPGEEMYLDEFIDHLKHEYFKTVKQIEVAKSKRRIMWRNKDNIYLQDDSETKIRKKISFKRFQPNKRHLLRLHDGVKEIADTFENMWDLTPDTELLRELPEEYTFETALADLIDNSLQAVWSNGPNERRLVSVTINEHGISIFDTGPGMDNSDENSIVKWGKMGASLHRSSRGQAIGGKPPYLTPCFGMFGYGGPIASMHLGKHALVSSKTKESKRVYTLHLEREALISSSGEQTWKTDGGIRDPLEDEINSSLHGSFTKVEIFEPKMRRLDTFQLKCRLKDIYFPYIQCDEVFATGRTTRPIEFQVNGDDLAEIEGGEVAITNLHSCNGPEFVLQLRFSINQDTAASNSLGSRPQEANARLKCVYYPIVEGKESIDRILEKLEAEGCGVTENFDTFCRVSIRRLGRLLPDARWGRIPFMEPRQKKGDKAQVLKRCCLRVKCFVETDAGFNPTPSKTDLAHHHPYTTALKNFGNKPLEREKDITVEIHRGRKPLSLSQLEKEYQDWIFQMHDGYDEEIDCGEDPPVLVVSPCNKKGLGIVSDVVRVHKAIRRKGASWNSGQNIKILKGAAAGCHKNNLYVTLEYILLEGFQGDVGGEARLICRPLGLPVEKGCLLTVEAGNASLDIQSSLSFPISVIDSGKCQAMEIAEWKHQLEKLHQKAPSTIDILSIQQCRQLEMDGALPIDAPVSAGHVTPKEIVAVVRPVSFISSSASKILDQKYIVKDNLEMSMEIKYSAEERGHHDGEHIYAERIKPSLRKGFHGLYIFSLGSKFPKLFRRAGVYTFSFSAICTDSSHKKCEKTVLVKPSSKVGKWGLLSDERSPSYNIRVGSCFPHLLLACYDVYNNRMPFMCIPEVIVKINMKGGVLVHVDKMKADLLSNKMILEISDILIEGCELDKVRPDYDATLEICQHDELFTVSIPCLVSPGPLHHIRSQPPKLEKRLLPGDVIEELLLEMFDAYDNHVKRGMEVYLDVNGFCFQDDMGAKREVDDHGCINLSGLLKVIGGYGKDVSLSVYCDDVLFYNEVFQVEKRELRAVSVVPYYCVAGSQLENIVFEIVNSEGAVDETIHDDMKFGQYHTLMITSESSDINGTFQNSFRHGRCTVAAIPIPREQGIFTFVAAHSHHPELCMTVKFCVMQAPKLEMDSLTEPNDLVQSQHSNGGVLLLQDTSVCSPKHMETLVESIMNNGKELENDVSSIALCIGTHEKKLKVLNEHKEAIEQGLCDLQASIDPQSLSQLDYLMNEKEVIVKRIEEKCETAASIYCNLSKAIQPQEPQNHFMQDIVGLVALLGTVNSNNLSRIFAEFLGEDNMLAVVCKSYAAASYLERYEKNGEVDREHAFHATAAALGKSINGRFLVICLEDISPYTGNFKGDDPQRKLTLQDPLLPTGKIPPGFLGYAVNMINLDIHHLYTRTAKGHGLRETLFYLLFGELQVYETRVHMKQARAYIKHGAISLDGGIMKGNGVLSLGYWEPEVRFPVVAPEVQRQLSPHTKDILKQIEDKKVELETTCNEIGIETKAHRKAVKKFVKKSERLKKFMEEKEPLLSGYYLEYKSNVKKRE